MTYKELYLKEHPDCRDIDRIIKCLCPGTQLKGVRPPECVSGKASVACPQCWDREIPEKDLYVHSTIVSNEKETLTKNDVSDPLPPLDYYPYEPKVKIKDDEIRDKVYEIKTAPKNSEEAFAIQKKLYEAIGVAGETAKKASENLAKTTSSILDSGTRREFSTGAVRDIQEGKGRCDLMPLDVLYDIFDDAVFDFIYKYQQSGEQCWLVRVLLTCGIFSDVAEDKNPNYMYNTLLEVAKHFEAGAKKYGEYNWQKGIPTHCYIDSAVRHYLKFLRGDKDEPHDRAFVWNILCCIWTCKHKPELNDYPRKEKHS